jgi:hypothetical protein
VVSLSPNAPPFCFKHHVFSLSQSGHDDFANKTMSLLRGVMDLYRRQKEQQQEDNNTGIPDDVTSPDSERTTQEPGI